MSTSMKDEALRLARAGYAVFPCRPNSKQPLHMGSFKDATVDEFQIEAWWNACPDANIAIYPYGSNPRLAVLDVDVRDHGEDGRETLREIEEHFPVTKSVWTPGGGMHLYYSLAEGQKVSSSTRRLGPGLDVRAHGGYVLVPPSVIDGKRYKWKDDNPVVPATDRFIEMAGAPEKRHPDADKWLCEVDLPANIENAREWLRGQVAAGRVAVSGEGGNNFTYATAAVLRDFGLSEDTTVELLETLWNPHCLPPHEPGWVATITENAYNFANRPAGNRVVANPRSLDQMVTMAAEAGTPATDPGELLKWDDIMNLPDPTYIIEDAIQEQSLVMVYGAYGVYKTFVGVDLLMSVATGHPWMGLKVSKSHRVVYVTPEGVSGFKWRLTAWVEGRKKYSGVIRKTISLIKRMPMFGDIAQVQELYELVKDWNPDVLVLDTLAHAMAGMDENAQKDAGLFIARAMMLRDKLGCTVVIIHHTGKDESRGARGASGIPAACDTVFEVSNPAANVVQVEMKKQKDGERWRKPRFYSVARKAHSLVLEYDATPPVTDRTITQDKNVEALKEVLTTDSVNPPLGNTRLAEYMAEILWAGEGSPGPDLQKSISNWLGRPAQAKSLELAPWVHAKTEGGTVSLWAPPKKDDGGS